MFAREHISETWASAHREKGSTDPLEKLMKNKKSENMQKEQFSEYFDSNQGRQV